MGFLSGMDAQKLYSLEEHIRPAMLTGAPQDRDRKRAEMLREATKASVQLISALRAEGRFIPFAGSPVRPHERAGKSDIFLL